MLNILLNKIGSYQSKILLLFKYTWAVIFLLLAGKISSLITSAFNLYLTGTVFIITLSLPLGYLLGIFIWRLYYKAECNICGWQGKSFLNQDAGCGRIIKKSICASCESHSRHRLMFIYLNKIIPKNKIIKILHVSPELSLQKFIQARNNSDYLSIDIDPSMAMQAENLEKMSFSDNQFDLIICSHVLEHVKNDKLAIAEIFRVTKKNGIAIISVPIDIHRAETYEDENIKSPEDRTKHFWYQDHLRLYGLDFPNKLGSAGFKVNTHYSDRELRKRFMKLHGLVKGQIYFCYKL